MLSIRSRTGPPPAVPSPEPNLQLLPCSASDSKTARPPSMLTLGRWIEPENSSHRLISPSSRSMVAMLGSEPQEVLARLSSVA